MRGEKICGAKAKTTGQPCKRPPMENGRCRLHGGMSPKPGPEHPRWVHGRRSKLLPRDLQTRYVEMMEDPELLSLRPDLAIVNAMIEIQLQGVDVGATLEAMRHVRPTVEALQKARARGDVEGMLRAIARLEELTDPVEQTSKAFEAAGELMDRRGRLLKVEHDRMKQIEAVISVDRVLALVAALVAIIGEQVHDLDTRARIMGSFREIIRPVAARAGVPGQQTLDAGGGTG